MEKDPVCNMQVNPDEATGKAEFEGNIYYFCSAGLKRRFDANPAQFAGE